MKNIVFLRLVLVIGLMFLAQTLLAQPGNPPADPESVPIDGGLSLLLAAGAALGGKKIWDARKQKQNPAE